MLHPRNRLLPRSVATFSPKAISILTRAVVAVVVLSIGVGLFFVLVSTGRTTPQVAIDDLRPRVVVFEARRMPVARQWTGYGTAEAIDYADVPARVTATVEAIPPDVQAGLPVEAEQVLVRLDASDYQRQAEIAQQTLAELQAQLEQLAVERRRLAEQVKIEQRELEIARSELERVQSLYAQDAARSRDVDAAQRTALAAEARYVATQQGLEAIAPRRQALEARIAGQRSSLRRAQQDVERTQVRSPIAGVLQDVLVRRGENVGAGQPVARVVNLDRIEVPLRLPTLARPTVGIGDVAAVNTTGEASLSWEATITRIAPEADPQSRTMTAYVEVAQPGAQQRYGEPATRPVLTPGTFVTGQITARQPETRWVVPRRSIRNGRIMTVEQGQLRSVPVTALFGVEQRFEGFGLPDRQWMVVDAPLRAGDQVLVNVPTDFSDGLAVTPVKATAVADASVEASGPQDEEARP
jgi:RND family efflux transporter MFP subunit